MNAGPWLERAGVLWLNATEGENDFAEEIDGGVAVRERGPTLVTQARLGYCWSHLALLFPQRAEFKRAAEKSFRFMQYFNQPDADFRVYDNSFFLLFMAWYYRLTNEPSAIRLLMNRYTDIERHFGNAGVGGFGVHAAGLRSHNPYMHLLEAMLAAFQSTQDEFWLSQARRIVDLFTTRLLDPKKQVVFELRNAHWSVAGDGRVEIGHQLEWSTLLRQLGELRTTAEHLYEFALRHGFEDGMAIDAVNAEGVPMDRRKLLWVQTEAVRHLAGDLAEARWKLIRRRFFHPNGWTWYNRLTAEDKPIEEPSLARLLYHVVTAAAETEKKWIKVS